MKLQNGILSDVQPTDLTIDGWFIVKKQVKAVDSYAFDKVKTVLKKVVFENGCEIVGFKAFEGCIYLSGVLLPQTLNEIGAGAFSDTSLSRIEIPESVKSVRNCAFMNCQKLKTVIFHGDVDCWKQQIGKNFDGTLLYDYVFSQCPNIEKFVYHKKPCFQPNFTDSFNYELHPKAQIVVLDDQKALDFWQKSLQRSPLSYKSMDDARATEEKYSAFREECQKTITEFYARRNPNINTSSWAESAMKIDRSNNNREK